MGLQQRNSLRRIVRPPPQVDTMFHQNANDLHCVVRKIEFLGILISEANDILPLQVGWVQWPETVVDEGGILVVVQSCPRLQILVARGFLITANKRRKAAAHDFRLLFAS